MKALKAKPRMPAVTASATRLRSSGARNAPSAPQAPQASIWDRVHRPWARKKLDANAASIPPPTPARTPSAAPATIVISVTGWTPGIAANRTRPAAAAPASVATSAISFADSGPPSNHTSAQPSNAAVTNQIDTRESPVTARTRAMPNAPTAPARTALLCLYKDSLTPERDRPVSNAHGEDAVVGHDERGARRSLRAEKRGELALALRVDAARGL